jgi:hypothetical protein
MIQNKWKALITVDMRTMTATMDASITNIAFPVPARVFHTEVSVVMWVTVAFVPHEVGKGIGSLGVSVSLGFIAGPIMGGLHLKPS